MTPDSPHVKSNNWLVSQWQQARQLFYEYPSQFWVLVFGTFIDHLGGALLFPFFSLYVTQKFGVGMVEVGVIFAIFSVTGLLSSMLGGALADRIGRKGILLFGLVMSAASALLMGLANDFVLFITVTAVVGLLADVGWPAQQAMVADLLPEEKRAQGYGIIRVVYNLAVVIGPMLGGLLAAYSFTLLFIIDAIASTITAAIIFVALKETKKPAEEGELQESMAQTFLGYAHVLRDSAFVWFLLASMLSVIVYMQMNTSLAVYLRDLHGVSAQGFGYILSLNASMVVLFQFPITRAIRKFNPMTMIVLGTLLYAIGFSMYGFVSVYALFLAAMVVITIGEMLVSPTSQAIVSTLAPEDMRGRYMATYGFSWVIPSAIGPLLAGLVFDHYDPRWIWYGGGVIGLIATLGFYLLNLRIGRARWTTVERRLDIIEQLEQGEITAEEAAQALGTVREGRWGQLMAGSEPPAEQRAPEQLHVRLSDQGSGEMRKEFSLPLGLLNTILHTDCRLSADLEARFDAQKLRNLVTHSMRTSAHASLENGEQRVELFSE